MKQITIEKPRTVSTVELPFFQIYVALVGHVAWIAQWVSGRDRLDPNGSGGGGGAKELDHGGPRFFLSLFFLPYLTERYVEGASMRSRNRWLGKSDTQAR